MTMAGNGYTNIYGTFFDSKTRDASMLIQKKAVQEGRMKSIKDVPCVWCGQLEGIKAYHCEDYNDPVGDAQSMCWRCHMMWHSRFRAPGAVFRYIYEVTVLGKQYPPVHKFDLGCISCR